MTFIAAIALVYLWLGVVHFVWRRERLFLDQEYGVWESRPSSCKHPPWVPGTLPECDRCLAVLQAARILGTFLSVLGWPYEAWQLR